MSGFQSFEDPQGGGDHPVRLSMLRERMAMLDLDAFIVPRADAHQGEYVAEADARLAWLTGFTGSAGFAIVTMDRAGVFIDGRYRVQVKSQVDLAHFTPVPWPETKRRPGCAMRCLRAARLASIPGCIRARKSMR